MPWTYLDRLDSDLESMGRQAEYFEQHPERMRALGFEDRPAENEAMAAQARLVRERIAELRAHRDLVARGETPEQPEWYGLRDPTPEELAEQERQKAETQRWLENGGAELMAEANRIGREYERRSDRYLDDRAFTLSEAAQVVGVEPDVIRQWVARGVIQMGGPMRLGAGRRRLYCGSELMAMRAVRSLGAMGLPMKLGFVLGELVKGRARALMGPVADPPRGDYQLAFFPKGDDWVHVPPVRAEWERELEGPDAPDAFVVLNVDRIVLETIGAIDRIHSAEPTEGDAAEEE